MSKNFNLTHWSIAPQPIGWFNEMSFLNGMNKDSGIRIYLENLGRIKEPVMVLARPPVLA